MEATGRSFAEVLAEAQRLGYAEADPTMDVGGFDAAHKITILAALAFGCAPNYAAAEIEGIDRRRAARHPAWPATSATASSWWPRADALGGRRARCACIPRWRRWPIRWPRPAGR